MFYNQAMALKQPLLSIEAYLELEAKSSVKHEYVGGEIFALAGGTKIHNQLALSLVVKLWDKASAKGCSVFSSDVKLRVSDDIFYYPDVMVVCEANEDALYATAPCLIVEVLSDSTEVTDRREKLLAYQRLASLQAYVLVSTQEKRVERYHRHEVGWIHEVAAPDGEVHFPCPDLLLSVDEIYEGLEL